VASLHKPVRGSRCPAPLASSSGEVDAQPNITQVVARTLMINFMNGSLLRLVGPFACPQIRCRILSHIALDCHHPGRLIGGSKSPRLYY
jgi:hypothetical protein